jgi:hypothetical protein
LEVRSWVRVAAAVGGAPDLAHALAADATELLAAPGANDASAAAAAARSIAAQDGSARQTLLATSSSALLILVS